MQLMQQNILAGSLFIAGVCCVKKLCFETYPPVGTFTFLPNVPTPKIGNQPFRNVNFYTTDPSMTFLPANPRQTYGNSPEALKPVYLADNGILKFQVNPIQSTKRWDTLYT